MKKLLFIAGLFLTMVATGQRLTINIGTAPNSGNGDPLRTAFTKTNSNFQYLFDSLEYAYSVVITDTIALDTMRTGFILPMGSVMAGLNLVRVEAYAGESAGTRAPEIDVIRRRSSTNATMTSAGATFLADATINTSYDDIQKGDRIDVTCALAAGDPEDAPYGILVILYFRKP